ncbi:MAG TPA: flagellar biosynthetic protein FliO [Candidatus Polarisedimenticolia bacterium]|nr:flagellar biosynthetic protein FliO [Candidatus Polarisedimenticolia bacterium]
MGPADALAAAPEAPSLLGALLRSAALLAVLAGGGWALLRWQRRTRGARRFLEVIDRAFLARGASLALVRVCGRRLLLGISSDGVRLVSDLGDAPGEVPAFARQVEAAIARESSA